jgi:hypothetical protein
LIAEKFDKHRTQRRILRGWRFLAMQKQELRTLEDDLEEKKQAESLSNAWAVWRKHLALSAAERRVAASSDLHLVQRTWNQWTTAS